MKSNNKKLSLKNINFLVEQLLQEQVFGNLAYVYHGSNSLPNVMLDLIKNKKFIPGHGAGAMYGPGLYTIREFNPRTLTFGGGYGEYVYKFKANLAGVVSFDSNVTQQIYGKSMSIRDQIKFIIDKNLVGPSSIQKLKEFLKSNQNDDLDKLNYDFDFSSKAALKNWESLIGIVRGISFSGGKDGPVVIFYSLNGVVPVAWSKTGGETQKDFMWNQFGVDSQKQNYDYEPFDQIKNNDSFSKSALFKLIDNLHIPNIQKKIIYILENFKSMNNIQIPEKIKFIKNIFTNKNYNQSIGNSINNAISKALEDDEMLAFLCSNDTICSMILLKELIKSKYEKVRLNIVKNKINMMPISILEKLIEDENKEIRQYAKEFLQKRKSYMQESLHRRIKMLLRETL